MSIAMKNEINALKERVEKLERICNKLNDVPRTVAGVPDRDPEPAPTAKEKKAKKAEGNQ